MGGYGSGWQGAKKATVEGSLVLTAASLVRKRALVAGAWTSGSWGWTYDGEDKPHATILGPGQRMAPASLSTERGAGGLQCPARDLNAVLWRAPVVVYLPAGAE
jgi:hypothetical protein